MWKFETLKIRIIDKDTARRLRNVLNLEQKLD